MRICRGMTAIGVALSCLCLAACGQQYVAQREATSVALERSRSTSAAVTATALVSTQMTATAQTLAVSAAIDSAHVTSVAATALAGIPRPTATATPTATPTEPP